MDPREFKKALTALEKAFDTDPINVNSHNVDDCTRCTNSVFCKSCDRCYKCSYCTECESSTNLTHCVGCSSCHHVANSVQCVSCTSSAFLVMCRDMSECNYCFGCVGLSRKDFHILNEPYDRSTYFKIIKELALALRIPSP